MTDKRTKRIRNKIKKVSSRNRLSVFRSNNHIYAQAIDDSKGITLASASTLDWCLAFGLSLVVASQFICAWS